MNNMNCLNCKNYTNQGDVGYCSLFHKPILNAVMRRVCCVEKENSAIETEESENEQKDTF